MRYALNLPIGGPCSDPWSLAELAALAEDSGWDGVFVEDYIVYQGQAGQPTHDPWVALAAMAVRTKRVRLGTMVTPVTRRRPWKLAREVVSLDHLSGGRVTLCVGLGDAGLDTSFSSFGEETHDRTRAGMLDEALELITGLWTGLPYSFGGRHYTVRATQMLPRPLQEPRVPIWVGGAYPNRGPMLRAAKWDGANLYRARSHGSSADSGRPLTLEEFKDLHSFIERRRSSHSGFDFIVHPDLTAPLQGERARLKSLEDAGATWAQTWFPPAELRVMEARIRSGPILASR
jgi:alkanesulfonate monooxygenase SsuD/methylene tetrahydromethanopterin reductase-like flavin-dependent oxidoreductase (luciferase family)